MSTDPKRPSQVRQREDMFPLMQAWEESNQSQKAFCADHGIKPHIFWYWLRRYRDEGQASPKAVKEFISIELESTPAQVVLAEIIYSDGTRVIFKERVGLPFLQGLLPKV